MTTHKGRTFSRFNSRSGVAAYLLLLGLLAAGCGPTAQVSTDYNAATNFSRFHTYSWRKGTISGNSLLDQRIVSSVNRELQKKGLREVAKGGDLNVTYHVSLERRLDVYGWDYLNGPYWSYWNRGFYGRTEVREVPEGKIVIDLIDGRRNQLVWRGMSVDQLTRDEGDLESHISHVTAEMFEEYPPNK